MKKFKYRGSFYSSEKICAPSRVLIGGRSESDGGPAAFSPEPPEGPDPPTAMGAQIRSDHLPGLEFGAKYY